MARGDFVLTIVPLNKETVRHKYPISTVDELPVELHGARMFTTLDLKANTITLGLLGLWEDTPKSENSLSHLRRSV